jgi:ubiquinone/menaquinone biosynthesis C-methylase UbiE
MSTTDTQPDTVDWTDVASGWDTHRGHVEHTKAELSDRMLAGLDLRPGERVLELGAGTGELARRLAAAVGDKGHVLASDLAAGMVELIRRTTEGLPNVDAARVDAVDTQQPDAAFDAVVFRMGLMLVPTPERALREIRRILAPGGRLAAATWAGPEHNPWLTTAGMSMMLHGLVSGGPPVGPGGPLSLGDPETLERLAREADLDAVSVELVDVTARFADVDAHLEHVASLAPPLALAFRAASEDQRQAVRATLDQATDRFRTDDGLVIPGRALLLLAHKPT